MLHNIRKQKNMKKVVFGLLVIAGSFFSANSVNAQTTKIGVFDVELMVRAMPQYRAIDSLVQLYERDSLRMEYDFALAEYNRLDSTYKADSAAKKTASVLNYIKDQRTQFATQIIYWQQIAQQKTEGKRQMLSTPLYQRIVPAYEKVLKDNNYLIVLKPEAIEFMGSTKVDNVFERVAKELKIQLPDELRSSRDPEPAPAVNKPAPTGTKPAPKKQ
jgi:Skp family chaperone for outer membrane proteins